MEEKKYAVHDISVTGWKAPVIHVCMQKVQDKENVTIDIPAPYDVAVIIRQARVSEDLLAVLTVIAAVSVFSQIMGIHSIVSLPYWNAFYAIVLISMTAAWAVYNVADWRLSTAAVNTMVDFIQAMADAEAEAEKRE